jgi:rod shape determining protein RodA
MQRDDLTNKLDWLTIFLYGIMVLLGWLNIYAAVYDESVGTSLFDLSLNSGRQLMFIAAAVVIILAILIVDVRFYEATAYLLYGLILVLMVLVLVVGKEVGGNKAWLGIGSFGIQPSEFAKFATALAVAKYIGSVGFRMNERKHQIVLFALIAAPMLITLAQKDTGTALVFTAFILVFFREGLSPVIPAAGVAVAVIFILTLLVAKVYLYAGIAVLWLLLLLAGRRKKAKRMIWVTAGALAMALVIQSVDYVIDNVLKPHQQNRIRALINPEADPLGYGWNVTQSKIAIGSGGLTGKGFLHGTLTKFDFVPEQSTDFIFCTIGEEHGWLGSAVVVGLFVVLLLRLIYLAERQRNRFARAYGYGVVAVLFFHFAVNIGMTIGLFPVIGIPLPFFSYGGSALWGFTILLFIFLKIDAHRSEMLHRL